MTRFCLAAFLLAILAVSPAARAQPFAYVPDSSSGVISVIDVNTGTVTATINTILSSARHVVINPAGTRVYIGRLSSSFLVIETTGNTYTTISTLNPPGFGPPRGMAINETGTRLYVSTNDPGAAKLVVLDAHTGAVLGSSAVGADPGPIAYSKQYKKVFVTHVAPSAGSVDVVDVSTDTPVTLSGAGYPIPVGNAFEAAAVANSSGDRIYVASSTAGEVNIIDASDGSIINTVAIPGASDIAINPVTFQVYVTSVTGTDIHEFDAGGNAVTTFGPVADDGAGNRLTRGISVSPDGSTLLLVSDAANAVMKYAIPNAPAASTGTAIAVGSAPHARGDFIGPAVILYSPGPPKNVTATLTGIQGQATVSFDPPDPTPGNNPLVSTYTYTVTSDGFTPVSASGSGSPITVSGLTNGLAQAFTVTATSANGEGARSAESNSVTPLATVPDPPTGVSAVAHDGGATISFTPPVNNGGTPINTYRAVSSPGGLNFLATSSPITAFSLTNGTSYTFTVTAFNSQGESAASSPSNAVVPTGVPQAPTVTGATAGNQEVSVAFTPPANDGGLPITSYTATSSPGGLTGTGAASPVVVTGLTNLTAYTFTVTATNALGTGPVSNSSAPRTPFQRPTPPTNLVASIAALGDVRVDCTAPSSAGDAPGGITSYTLVASPGGATSTKASGCPFFVAGAALTPGTSYTFTIAANTVLGSGPASAPSNAVVAVGKPGAPTGVTATANGPTGATVAFAPPANDGFSPITGYVVRSTPHTSFYMTAGSPVVVGPLNPGVSYTFTVAASNIAGEGPQSAPSNMLTAGVNPPTGAFALGGDGRATVTFNAPAGPAPPSPVTSYTVTSAPGGFTATSSTPRPVHVPGLANGTAYTFTVTAHYGDGKSATSTASNAVTPARLPQRSSPWAYVSSVADDMVVVIDTSSDRVINAIVLDENAGPVGVAVNPAGTRVYVAVVDGVAVIDTATQSVIANVPVPDSPFLVAVNPAGTRVYTTNSLANTVSVIDTATHAVTATIPVPDRALGVDVDPGGAIAYVSIPAAQKILRIDTATNAIVTTSPALGVAASGLAATPGNVLYSADTGSGQLATLTASTLAVESITALPGGHSSAGVAVDPAGSGVFFTRAVQASFDPGTVQKLGGGSVAVGVNPVGLAITPTGAKLYVTNSFEGSVSVIDSSSMTVTGTLLVGRNPLSIGRFIAPPIPQRLLSVTRNGAGSGTVVSTAPAGDISCGATCSASFDQGRVVTLTASAAAGSAFAGWSGACSGTGSCSVTMDAARDVTATFDIANPRRLANISTRGRVLTEADVMIGGFIIGGSSNKTVVVRARGPSLAAQDVPGVLANPQLQLFSGQTQIAFSDNWGDASNAPAIQSSGFAPSDPLESAILATLAPGAYTAIVTGVGQGQGVGIVEVFEVDQVQAPLLNIATRGKVSTGADVMIAGLIIQGDGPQTVVVRARGPSLAAQSVPGVLANPMLQLFSGATQIAVNDNWGDAGNATAIQASGFAPSDPQEAAMLVTLDPGAYTAIVTGVGATTGVAIVEVFAVVP